MTNPVPEVGREDKRRKRLAKAQSNEPDCICVPKPTPEQTHSPACRWRNRPTAQPDEREVRP